MSHDHNMKSNEQPFDENEDLEYNAFSEQADPLSTSSDEPALNTLSHADVLKIQQLEEELAQTKDQMLRLAADTENIRKRSIKEREDASKFAVAGFSRDVLNVADNLRRALEAMPAEFLEQYPQVKNLTDGIEATERELLRCFEKNGIKKIEPLNERFDPNLHEVMFEAPMPEKESGTVIQVIDAGYTLHGRILRPARVGVSKNDTAATPSGKPTGHTLDTEA